MTLTIDQIGEQAAQHLKAGEESKKLAKPLLDQVWAAFDQAKADKTPITINGATGKKAWARKMDVSYRYCAYIIKDGSRKGQKKSRVNSSSPTVVVLNEGMAVSVGGREIVLDELHLSAVIDADDKLKLGKPAPKPAGKKPQTVTRPLLINGVQVATITNDVRYITHIVGGHTAGGGQSTRMRSYALCAARGTARYPQAGACTPASARARHRPAGNV
jgi:hypothetical protein